jgi:hypothetical protein
LIQSGRDIHRKLPEWKLAVLLFQERSIVNLFKEVKVAVTARQVAERYGLKVNRAGMACCPFHDDRNPSMKLDDRFYCFGCGATGDAVDLTARLLDLTSKEAALQLASDFGIVPLEDGRKSKVVEDKMSTTKKMKTNPIVNWVDRAIRIMTDCLWKLREWKEKYAPQSMDDDNWHPLFCEALDKASYVEYVLDELLAAGKSEYEELRRVFGKEIERIEKRLERYAGRDASRD